MNTQEGDLHVGLPIEIEIDLNQGVLANALPADLDIRISGWISAATPESFPFRQYHHEGSSSVDRDQIPARRVEIPDNVSPANGGFRFVQEDKGIVARFAEQLVLAKAPD